MSTRVVVVGSINVDHTIVLDRFPQPGETLLASSMTDSVGGKGANQAVAAAKSGAVVTMVGMLGNDPEGDRAQRTLEHAGVDCAALRRVPDDPTGSAWITVAAGDNTILVVPGANHRWNKAAPPVGDDDVVLCQLEIPLAVVSAAAEGAGRFVLNAAPSQPLPDELLSRCDVLIVNEHELADISGRAVPRSDASDVVAASRTLLLRGVGTVVTTLGGRGAILCTGDQVLQATTPPVDVVDTTGAGDAFCGVFAAQLAGGASLGHALRAAVTAGSLSVSGATAQGSYDDLAGLTSAIGRTPEVTTLFTD